MANTSTLTVELNAEIVNQFNLIRDAVWSLRNEVNCRIEHGAESGGHLDYVQRKLDEILLHNADVDLPDTAAQDSASKSNSQAVSG